MPNSIGTYLIEFCNTLPVLLYLYLEAVANVGVLHIVFLNMSSDSKLQKLPLEIGLQIAGYLTAQELVNASASCKFFYTCFANQTVWEAAYRELLNGYPADHFVITDAVKHAKRPNYVNFHSTQEPQVEWLDDWRA